MPSTDLKSRTWCDIIFENRNKEYGAYRLRQQAGARYRYALTVVFIGTLILGFVYAAYISFARKQHKEGMEEAEKALRRMIPTELNSCYQIKMVSTARLVPSAAKGESEKLQGAPVIVDKVTNPLATGIKKTFQFHPNTAWTEDEGSDLTADDSNHAAILVKQKIIRTDDVSALPEFPGGARAFMHWLDENIIYPPYCQKRGVEGKVTVSFIIRKDGYATDFKVIESTNDTFAQAALNVLKRMPQWRPGLTPEGEPTPAMITIPILFKR